MKKYHSIHCCQFECEILSLTAVSPFEKYAKGFSFILLRELNNIHPQSTAKEKNNTKLNDLYDSKDFYKWIL